MRSISLAKIIKNKSISREIFDLHLETDAAQTAKMGQFVSVYTGNPAMLLPRPLSICEIDRENNTLRIIYRVEGGGTRDISRAQTGETLRILAPLGNGFSINSTHSSFAIVGGGIGVPPLLQLAKEIRAANPVAHIAVYMGFRSDDHVILETAFQKYADLVEISTDDGSYGRPGNAVQMLPQSPVDAVYGCGPKVMLRHLAAWAAKATCPALFPWRSAWHAVSVPAWLASRKLSGATANLTKKCAMSALFLTQRS